MSHLKIFNGKVVRICMSLFALVAFSGALEIAWAKDSADPRTETRTEEEENGENDNDDSYSTDGLVCRTRYEACLSRCGVVLKGTKMHHSTGKIVKTKKDVANYRNCEQECFDAYEECLN